MNTTRKFWLVLIGSVLGMAVIACSCNSLIPTPTPTPLPTATLLPLPTAISEPSPGLAGYWQDPENNDVHTIVWQNGQYVVTATNNPDHGSYQVTQQSWNGSALTWTYQVSNNNTSVTLTTVSVSGDSLDTNWTNSDGKSGTETLQRVSSPVPPQPVATMPLVLDSMAGRWNDPDTEGTVTTIIAVDGGGYAVQSVINPSRGANELTKINWSNGVLTWTYCIPNGVCYTSMTVSLSGDSLDTTWTDDAGSSGQTTFQRLP
jgi:hypothetical protein